MSELICLKGFSNYYYSPRDRLGHGSYSIVYKGKKEDGLAVAIKEIILNKKNNTDRDWYREIEIMKKFEHENLVKLYDSIQSDNNVYLILEYCDGGTFSDLEKPIDEEKMITYFKQILSGLIYLQKQNIYHRDIKPDNILLTKTQQIKICDFTFTRHYNNTDYLSATVCGSPFYMAPELFIQHKPDIKSDIWSLGIILYEYIYGNYPYPENLSIGGIYETLKQSSIDCPDENRLGKIVSLKCRNLLQSMLKLNISQRISWDQLPLHPWLNSSAQFIIPRSQPQSIPLSLYTYSSFPSDSLFSPEQSPTPNIFHMSPESKSPHYLTINNKQFNINDYEPYIPSPAKASSCPSIVSTTIPDNNSVQLIHNSFKYLRSFIWPSSS